MSERDDLIEQAHSLSVEVRCGDCGQFLGDQFRPGDGAQLARVHAPRCPNRQTGGEQ